MDEKSYFYKYKSGNSYNQKAEKTITNIGLALPFAMIGYGLLIQLNIVDSLNNNTNIIGFSLIMLIFVFIGILQKLHPGNTPLSSTLRLVEFHTLSGVYFLFVSGILNPFVACWPILMLASYTYFDKLGIKLSILALFIIVSIDAFIFHFGNFQIFISDYMIFSTIIITGIIVISVNKSHEIRKEKLFQSLLKESLQRGRVATIVNNLTDAVISTDETGVIKVYNAASLNLLDTNNSLIGRQIDNVLPLIDKYDNPISVFAKLKQSKSVVRSDDLYYSYDNGEKIRLSVIYTPIRNGYNNLAKTERHEGYIIIMRDITKEKSLDEERIEFVSVVNHELRTPITVAEGTISNVQLLMEKSNTNSSTLKAAINVAHDQILYLASMVNDLSKLTTVENGVSDKPEIINIKDIATNVIHKFSVDVKNKNLLLDLDIAANAGRVFANRVYLEELLQNLVSNAIKYTKKGSITLIISKNKGIITFAVKDTGIGIGKSDQSKVFNKFYRSEDFRTRETGGTGLGLYIATKLADKLGTKIELTSRLNFGSTFSFSLAESDNNTVVRPTKKGNN